MSSISLEVCVDSIESALAAVQGGAARIELCSALSEGGLTPTPGLLKVLKSIEHVKIPIFCMLRPRNGNDFQYSDYEMKIILNDLEILKDHGSDGFVFGALDNNININIEQCRQIITASCNLPVTFHRAFDLTDRKKMIENCNLIETMGFKRLLTSGFEKTSEMGLKNLKLLTNECNSKNFIIMPGAGINVQNAEYIIKETNCKEFHASARKEKKQHKENNISMGGGSGESVFVTDSRIVTELVAIGKMK